MFYYLGYYLFFVLIIFYYYLRYKFLFAVLFFWKILSEYFNYTIKIGDIYYIYIYLLYIGDFYIRLYNIMIDDGTREKYPFHLIALIFLDFADDV